MGIIRDWSNSLEDSLRTGANGATLISHPGLKGAAREDYLADALRKFLPRSLEIGCGQVFDHDGNLSNQVDIVISRGDSIKLPLGSPNICAYPLESVLATIEVKSYLEGVTLLEAFKNSKSMLDLGFRVTLPDPRSPERIEEGAWLTEEEVKNYPTLLLRPANYVYSFKTRIGEGIRRFSRIFFDALAKSRLSLDYLPAVIATDGFVVIRNDGCIIPGNSHQKRWLVAYREEKNPLYWILVHLLHRFTVVLGGSDVLGHHGRLHIETHLDELPFDGWSLVLDPREMES